MTGRPSVSIIIPAYNEEAVIRQCLEAAVYQTVPAHEIIVVDNRSTDATARVVGQVAREFPESPIRLLRQNEQQGLIPTRNYGLSAATGRVLGRIDADSLVEPTWVERVAETFSDPAVDGATGPVLYYDMPLRRFGLKADDRIRQLVLKVAYRQYHFLFGSNMAVRADAWRRIAHEVCRDEQDQMHEDIDVSVHMAQHEMLIRYVPDMIAGMSARRLEDSPKDYRYYVTRFDRTYRAHQINKPLLKIPTLIFMAIYYPAKALRYLHSSLARTT